MFLVSCRSRMHLEPEKIKPFQRGVRIVAGLRELALGAFAVTTARYAQDVRDLRGQTRSCLAINQMTGEDSLR